LAVIAPKNSEVPNDANKKDNYLEKFCFELYVC
jgi:hypothetical protein